MLKWNGFEEISQTWPQLKSHFEEGYKTRFASTGGTARTNGYVNHTEAVEDGDSISSIPIHLANNANYQALQDNVQASCQEAQALSQQLATMRAELTQWRANAAVAPPSVPAYVAAPAIAPTNAPAYIQPPSTYLPIEPR